jgi:S1-C subfamily serine protease
MFLFRPSTLILPLALALPASAQYQRPDPKVPKAEEQAIQAARKGAGPRLVTPRGPLQSSELSLIQAFRRAKPSVVYINAAVRLQNLFTGNVQQVVPGTGTGLVWDDLGHVVTNLHVVALDLPPERPGGPPVVHEVVEVEVTLSSGQTFKARVVGRSLEHDIAVLKVFGPLKDMRPIPIGRSADLQVGQTVLAIGNPFGLDHSLTTGVVSALDRELSNLVEDPLHPFYGRKIRGVIQTDAAINPGNSGGPLLDSAGRLIGMNMASLSTSGSSAGLGFALPVDTLNRVVPRLIARGQLQTPELGFSTMNTAIAARLGVKEGLPVTEVSAGSPAEKAGLRPIRLGPRGELAEFGDILLRFKGKVIENEFQLFDLVELESPEAPLEFEVLRKGERVKVVIRRDDVAKGKGPAT